MGKCDARGNRVVRMLRGLKPSIKAALILVQADAVNPLAVTPQYRGRCRAD
jgi:hypothetical protein